MKVIDILPEDALLEVNLRKSLTRAAVAGALGTGLLYGYGATPNLAMGPPKSISDKAVSSDPDDQENLSQFKIRPLADPEHAGELYKRHHGVNPDPEELSKLFGKTSVSKQAAGKQVTDKKPADTHDNFPIELWNQPKANADKKMQSFVFIFDPLIDKANGKILADRRYLLKITNHDHQIDDDEKSWVEQQLKRYNAATVADLLVKMDIVPKGMALAQGALESGWGTSSLARRGNAFFGMISGSGGFSAYKSPQDSVSDYIHNLNTHPAYKEFRHARAQARANRQKLNSWQLIGHLGRYSERGQAYISHVKDMMSTPYIKDLDENRLFFRY